MDILYRAHMSGSSYTTYLSIDVATRSLAIGVYRMRSFTNIEWKSDPKEFDDYLNSFITPLDMSVIDLNDGKKTKDTSVVEKAVSLKEHLNQVDLVLASKKNEQVVVLIEYQLNANYGANAIFNMIVYHYSGRYPVKIVKPSWKNTISFHPEMTLSNFLSKASSNYSANKLHTRCNMLYLLTMIDKIHMIKAIKKKNQDDIADTLMQAIAYHKNTNHIS